MYFDNLKIAKNVKKRAKNYELTIDKDIDSVIKGIEKHHEGNWVVSR